MDDSISPPPADPQAIRACLTELVAAEFDAEWDIVLERAKQAKDLTPIHDLLHKWRHIAYAELKDPGSYFTLLAKATRRLATGEEPEGGLSGDELKAHIQERLSRATNGRNQPFSPTE